MQALVINLDRSPERLAMFQEQAERLGFAFERLAAVDAATIPATPGPLTAGELACIASHRLAWRALVASDAAWLAVFEDDVWLAPPVADLLASDAWIPATADIVKLETFDTPVSIAPAGIPAHGGMLHRLHSTHLGSAGYVISRRWAAELLRRTERCEVPVDWILFDQETDDSFEAHVMQVIPAPCIQDLCLAASEGRLPVHETLILRPSDRKGPKLGGGAKFRREAIRIGCQIWRLPKTIRKGLIPKRQITVPYSG